MIPLKIENHNIRFDAPEGMPDVRPLYARAQKYEGDERLYIFSRWEPTPDELAILNAGGSVQLCIIGCQPPVVLEAVPHSGEE